MREYVVRPLAERFWGNVRKTNSCWLWIGCSNPLGYGTTSVKINGKHTNKLTHHIAFFLTYGRWPRYLMHSCDTPRCVNPKHLTEGSHRQNMQDAYSRGLIVHTLKTKCVNGHFYTPENTYYVPGKAFVHRQCRACKRMKVAAARAKARERNK